MFARLAFFSLVALPVMSGVHAAESSPSAPILLPAPRVEANDIPSLRAKADRGNSVAQYNLGLAYAQQRQSPSDLIEAFVWLTIAKDNGSTGKALESILPQLSPAQVEEGRRRVQMLRTANPQLRSTGGSAVPQIAPAEPAPAATSATSASSAELRRLREQLATAAEDKQQLSRELTAAWKEAERLEADLKRRAPGNPDLAALQKDLAIAQAVATNQSTEAATRRAEAEAALKELANTRSELDRTKTQLETLAAHRAQVTTDTNKAVADELRQKLGATETQLRTLRENADRATTAATTQAAHELTKVRQDLQAERARAETLARQLAANESATRDLTARSQVAQTLEAQLRETQARVTALTEQVLSTAAARDQAQQLADARAQELQVVTERAATSEAERNRLSREATASGANRDQAQQKLSSENRTLQQRLTQLEGELAQAQSSTKTSTDAQARVTTLTAELETLRNELTAAKNAVAGLASQKAATEAATREQLADAQRRLATTTTERDELQSRLAQAASTSASATQAQALATKLTGENDVLRKRLTDAEAELRNARDGARGSINQQLAALEQTRRSLTDTQQQLTAATQELATLRNAASAAGATVAQVRQLETEKATLVAQLNAAEQARATAATVSPVTPSANESSESERKLADALRSFSETSKERDELLAEVNALSAQLAVASTTLARLESNPRTPPASSVETPRPRVDSVNRGPQPAAQNETRQSPSSQVERPAAAVASIPVRSVNPTPVASGALAAPTRPSSAPPVPDVVAAAPAPAPRTHNVVQGDTLSSISRQYYGTSNRWQDILAANRDVLRNERDLVVGRTLRLP